MTLPDPTSQSLRQALSKAKERFAQAESANDLDAFIQSLDATRDALVQLASRARLIRDESRQTRNAA